MTNLKVFEAFSGYGSQSIALRNIGIPYEVVAISEIDKYAIMAYTAIHGETNNLGDISKIKIKDIPNFDLFTYSFPCQDISIAGKQSSLEEGSGTRSSLLWECKKIIRHKKPKYLLLENVKNLISQKHKTHFDEWLKWLEKQGYTNSWEILNAKDFNIPQHRERVFVISILNENTHKEKNNISTKVLQYKFPRKKELNKTIFDFLDKTVDKKYYLSEKGIEKMKRYTPKRDITDGICPTLTTELAHSTGKNVSPKICKIIGEYRRLTPKETFKLMGLKEEDIDKIQKTKISDTEQYRMAANSIVIPLLEEIFKSLFDLS